MKLYHVRAFLKTNEGGNKAEVVVDASGLNDVQMQTIAHEVGYSETAFVFPSKVADFTVRFFTPTSEVDLCGHATIATFNVLRDLGVISEGLYTQETKAGILQLDVQEHLVFMEQNPPIFGELLNSEDIKGCFKEEDIVDPRFPIQVVSTGIREIFLPVKSVDVLHSLTPDFMVIKQVAKAFNTIGIHVFSVDREVDAYGRNFAPVVGIDEESATGTSNGALSCYLYQYVDQKTAYVLRQGYGMNQPSELYSKLEITDQDIRKVWVGGPAKIIE